MRTVLHHPAFQGLEAAWRGLSFVVDRLETDSQLQLYLLDLPKSELSADLLHGDDLQSTELYRLLVHEAVRTPGAHPWAVVGGVYTFDRTTEDVAMLERIASVCKEAGAPFLAAASPGIVGCPSFGTTPDPDDWEAAAIREREPGMLGPSPTPAGSVLYRISVSPSFTSGTSASILSNAAFCSDLSFAFASKPSWKDSTSCVFFRSRRKCIADGLRLVGRQDRTCVLRGRFEVKPAHVDLEHRLFS